MDSSLDKQYDIDRNLLSPIGDMSHNAMGKKMGHSPSPTQKRYLHFKGPLAEAERERNRAHRCPRFIQTELDDPRSFSFWRAGCAEFLATALLCFFHIGILLSMPGSDAPSLLQVSLGHGLFVAVVVTALSETSGCHMNPAVTIAFASLRLISLSRAVVYITLQCAGAITGSLLLRAIVHSDMVGSLGVIAPGADISDKQVILTEVIITGFLLFVVMATSDPGRTDLGGSVPLIVGLTISVNTLLANKTSGSCMNPARALGPAVVTGTYQHLWMYCFGPCTGALIGSLLYHSCFAVTSSLPGIGCCCKPGHPREHARLREDEASNFGLQVTWDALPESDL